MRLGAAWRGIVAAAVVLGGLGAASNGSAFEALEGKLQVHGFFEQQIRTLARDFDGQDNFDLAQWYHVLNVEIDYDIAPDGWGPFTLVSMFARAEVRYDCVWSRACGLLSNANVYGDRAHHLPKRLSDARERGFVGNLTGGDFRHELGQLRDRLEFGFRDTPVGNRREPGPLFNVDGLAELFSFEGPDDEFFTADDPGPYVFERFSDFRFGARKTEGPTHGAGVQVLGPWLPQNRIHAIGTLRDRWNPFRGPVDAFGNARADGGDSHPVATYPFQFVDPQGNLIQGQPITPGFGVLAPNGSGRPIADVEKPFRVAPDCAFGDSGCDPDQARGLFYPSPALAKMIRQGEFDSFDQNFSQDELSFNRGASQQNEKELKELYVDLELLDSALWLRLGKQNIVWGKTELFRTTDQFNPQDFALATLPELEESRIALWAARGVYAFYEVGPFEDVRLELAFNFDQVEPADIGRCGEPFAVNLVCLKSYGLLAHGFTGVGLAGEVRPPNPWENIKGLEVGGRLEFRWGRFSFQVSDFYGYEDFPTIERLYTYSRNVDPQTGMLRRAGATGPCSSADNNGDGLPDRTDPACLQPGADSLLNHPANQSLFAVACGATLGFNLLEPSSCAVDTLNSRQLSRVNINPDLDPNTPPLFTQLGPIPNAFSLILQGSAPGKFSLGQFLRLTSPIMAASGYLDWNGDGSVTLLDVPFVALTADPLDDRPDIPGPDVGVDSVLSAQQEALLGCGPFYEVPFNATVGLQGCTRNGVDLLNAEASALVQSWPGIEGTSGAFFDFFAAGLAGTPVPGTTGFTGGPVCTVVVNGVVVQLPGCRGPADSGYNVNIDGTPPNGPPALASDISAHPFACATQATGTTGPANCQQWRSEMAALSWNLLVSLVMLSGANEDPALAKNQNRLDFFDPTQPFSTTRCSFARMHLCQNVQSIFSVLGVRRAVVRAGGVNGFGRRDFAWHQGGEVFVRYEKRNVLGFAMDFAEDVTKSNWGVEMTWIEGIPFVNNDQFDGLSRADTFNMTVSVDRPTFINFLNANRTFFFNSQWFFQYVNGYRQGFTTNGPFNVLGTFTILTGYFQDRLLPQVTFVHDLESGSGGFLSKLTYRFNEKFSATFGLNTFYGRFEKKTAPINDIIPTQNRVGPRGQNDFVENLLALVKDRDELFLQIRYTF